MYNLTCNSKNHITIALIFAAAMLLSSWLMQGQENSAVVFIGLISAYPLLTRLLKAQRSAGC
jgi:hypothetical protein